MPSKFVKTPMTKVKPKPGQFGSGKPHAKANNRNLKIKP